MHLREVNGITPSRRQETMSSIGSHPSFCPKDHPAALELAEDRKSVV